MTTATSDRVISLDDAMKFVWLEADLLDHASYDEWLDLWTDDGKYIVPIGPGEGDFEARLNLAYDNAELRRKRVERLQNGHSISASPVARTVRTLSRFRMLSADADRCELRCAQMLTEFRRGRERFYSADLKYHLVRDGAGFRIDRKIIWLINSTYSTMGISYVL